MVQFCQWLGDRDRGTALHCYSQQPKELPNPLRTLTQDKLIPDFNAEKNFRIKHYETVVYFYY